MCGAVASCCAAPAAGLLRQAAVFPTSEGGNGVPVQLARSALLGVIATAEAAGNEWAQDQLSTGSVMGAAIANLEAHADDTIPPCVSIDTLLWQFLPHAFPDLLPMNEA